MSLSLTGDLHNTVFFSLVFLFSISSIWDQNSIPINQHAYAKQDQPICMSLSGNESGQIINIMDFTELEPRGPVSVISNHQKQSKEEPLGDISLASHCRGGSPLPKRGCGFLSPPSSTRDKGTEAWLRVQSKNVNRAYGFDWVTTASRLEPIFAGCGKKQQRPCMGSFE